MKTVYFNGIRADSGSYAYPPRPLKGLVKRFAKTSLIKRSRRARQPFGEFVEEFTRVPRVVSLISDDAQLLQPLDNGDLDDLTTAGWGVMYPKGEEETLLTPMRPLLNLRRRQAGPRYREIAYQPGQELSDILDSQAQGSGKIPYYLLIVGSPNQIPYYVQYGLDRKLAVGRLTFDDPKDYGTYARTTVRHDQREVSYLKTTLFGTRHPDEPTTALSADFLVNNLGKRIANSVNPVKHRINIRMAERATKTNLSSLMGGSLTPDMLLTATHGLILSPSAKDRPKRQGALLCSEYPGPEVWGGNPIPGRMIFSGKDIGPERNFNGMIALIYACFGGGTPSKSSFPLEPQRSGRRESYKPFVAHLPKRMLAAENGCRAVIAHVDTAYIWSFTDAAKREKTETFQVFFRALLEGRTIGFAMNAFQQAHQDRLAHYLELVEAHNDGRLRWQDDRLVQAWFAVNDLRNHILLGDPAVRLPAVAA